jgi:hypothetical protein
MLPLQLESFPLRGLFQTLHGLITRVLPVLGGPGGQSRRNNYNRLMKQLGSRCGTVHYAGADPEEWPAPYAR